VSIVLGCLWGLQFPIIKKIWTSSYVLVAGGYGAIMVGLFYLVIDIWKIRAWAMPFVWIGMNPITIYLVAEIVGLNDLARRLAGGEIKSFFDSIRSGLGDFVLAAVALGLCFLLVRFLYNRKIFLRV
jgi:predicted acyltransferase